ncbi:hypothetical protein, partial [Paenibacillus ferrarius]|uniref:hypothetical protein n=1 Tax=Paenibacillus ferrarius TaxID=1469647 RepID=UPI001ABF5D78
NVIKISSKTKYGIKMNPKTAWEKSLCRLFFMQTRKKAHSKQTDGISAKKMVLLNDLCYSVDEANS